MADRDKALIARCTLGWPSFITTTNVKYSYNILQ